MITRRVSILALLLVVTFARAQILPVSSAGDDNDCALYLTGPGRSSAFDYNLNLLRGSLHYEGQHTCITYDAVNAAYIDARKRINVATPKGDWKTEDIASVGELMLDISINLARTYGLTYEDIEKGLPLIDTTKTLIREVCPPFLSHVECRAGKYRRFDGLCTNLAHPTWGASMTPFQRLIAPLYADGINAPRVSVTGRDLPLSRVVSRTMHPDDGFHDHAGTVMVIAWGQFMDHDYTLTGTPLDPRNRNDPEECCNRPPHRKHPYCNELRIPDDDYFYRLFNVKCIDFVRGFPSPRAGCRLGSRQQFNTLTGVLDGNTVYGVNEKFSRKLRSGVGGLLRMNPVFEEYGLKDLLPLKLDIPDEGCTRPNKSMYCFEAGEIRVNEQLVLTCMHTLMAREHNRVARGLGEVNPHWDDETIFQEARRIIIAEIQHITYNEFLPILLGKEVMEKFGLLLNKEGHWDGYDENVNPSVIDAFSAAAFRFGHSLLPTAVERWSKAHKFISSKRLSDLIRRPFDLYRAGIFDEYLMGLMNQVAQAMDDSITQEVTNHLFKKPGARFGMDLVSFNMQRGREFGLPGYMEFRKFCGLPGANSFQELFGSMPNDTIQRYESIFEHPSDVDLWSGGVSERPLPGSMLGPTFACVIATQFSYSRRGDRFWYELPNQPSSFTPEQLAELKKARLARVICDNTDIIDTVQVYPMVLPDHEINPRVPCRSGIMPSMDFTKWADYGGQQNIPSNPYERETQVTYPNITTPNNSTVDDSGNKTAINLLELIKPKSLGHYKNSLRRKRRDAINFNTNNTFEATVKNATKTNDIIINSSNITDTTKHTDIITDLEVAAITVTEVTGSHIMGNENLPKTTVPNDQRDETSPQTFTLRTHINSDTGYRKNKYFQDKFEDEEQVSQKSPREHLKHVDHNINVDTDYKFIPDTDENSKIAKEEGSQPITKEFNNHVWKKNNHNKKRFGKHSMGFGKDRTKQPYFSGTFADESDEFDHRVEEQHSNCDPEREFGTGSRSPSGAASGASGLGSNAKHTKGVCQTGSSSMEHVNTDEMNFEGNGEKDEDCGGHEDEYEDDQEGEREDEDQEEDDQFENKASEKQNSESESENVKDQFEHVPLDYNHDKVQENKKENIKFRAKKPKLVLAKLDLGDITVSLPEIRLPEIVFGVYNDDYFDSLRSTNKRGKPSDYVHVDTIENKDDDEEEDEEEVEEEVEEEEVEEEEDEGHYYGRFNPYRRNSDEQVDEDDEIHTPNLGENNSPEENSSYDISLDNPNIRIRYSNNQNDNNREDENENDDDEENKKDETDVEETRNSNVRNDNENKNVLNERYNYYKNNNHRNNENTQNDNKIRNGNNEPNNDIITNEENSEKKPHQVENREEEEDDEKFNDEIKQEGKDTKNSPVILHRANKRANMKKIRAKDRRLKNSKVLKFNRRDEKDVSESVKEYVS